MGVTIEIPAALRRHAGGHTRLQTAAGDTVGEALQKAVERFPTLRAQMFAGDGRLFGFVGVFLNSQDIRRLDGTRTPLSEGDVITVVPAIAGG